MMTKEDKVQSLRSMKRSLIKAHDEITSVAELMEAQLTTEYDQATSWEYGSVCRVLGILEEQIAEISNQLTKLNSL